VFGTFKIFHNWLRRRTVENRQMYPLVNIDTGHLFNTSTNMTLILKFFFLPSFLLLSFLLALLEAVLYIQDELFYSKQYTLNTTETTTFLWKLAHR